MPEHVTLPDVLRAQLDGDGPLEVIAVPTGAVDAVELVNFTTVGSYSFVDCEEPTLLIPSAPAVARVRLPVKILSDKGDTIIDGNGHKFPSFPLEPAIHVAALLSGSALDFAALDFVLDRNCLRKLFGMIRGGDAAFMAFKIDGELVGDKTVILSRSEADVWDRFEGFKGFAESFRKSQTVPVRGLEDATLGGASWRISKLDLGPFQMLIRYECNAQQAVQARSDSIVASPVSVPDLADLLAAATLAPAPPPTHTFPGQPNLSYRLTDVLIPPQSSLVEVKTRPGHKPVSPTKYWDQMFFSQTQHLWLATYGWHVWGKKAPFDGPLKKFELDKGELKEYGEGEGMDFVARVVKMLGAMKEIVVREGKAGHGVSFVFETGMDALEVWRTKEGARKRLVGEEVNALFG